MFGTVRGSTREEDGEKAGDVRPRRLYPRLDTPVQLSTVTARVGRGREGWWAECPGAVNVSLLREREQLPLEAALRVGRGCLQGGGAHPLVVKDPPSTPLCLISLFLFFCQERELLKVVAESMKYSK